jgi:isoquinoline 1-oxidoreductase alpha subunit
MAVAGLLAQIPNPTDDEIDAGLTNVCRCGTFARMRAAIHAAAESKGTAA